MNIHVIGAGAIGKLLASGLASIEPKIRLALVTHHRAQAAALNESGLILRREGHDTTCPVRALAWSEYESGGPGWSADAVFLTVKQQHVTASMLQSAARQLAPDGIVVAWMNGIGHESLLAQTPGSDRSALAITTEAALSPDPVTVVHTGSGQTALGLLRDASPSAQAILQKVGKCLKQAGFVNRLSNDIGKEAWNKLVINAVINPLTAIYGISNGDLLTSPPLRRKMRTLFQEARAVAARAGVNVEEALWDQLLDVCRRTARNRSSMLQDVTAGKQTEVAWINGSLIRAAERYGLDVPGHRAVFDAVRGIENTRNESAGRK